MSNSVEKVEKYLQTIAKDLHGELDTSNITRALYSTDASNYRVVPIAVFCPFDIDDVISLVRHCLEQKIPLTARGAGTSCAGNAIGPGVVLDFSKHMNKILALDPERQLATVEPGCIQSTLQLAANEYGLRFGPDPSTHNRCTIGGMVGNNACGPHATAWGKTSDNVVGIKVIDGRGRIFQIGTSLLSSHPDSTQLQAGAMIPGLEELVLNNLETIRTEFGRFGRQVSGYALDYLIPENRRNLPSMLVGTEGTLVTVLEVTVRLVPLPKAPVLVALGYPDMISAGYDVKKILPLKPLAVEGMDSRLVDVVRAHNKKGSVPDLPAGAGWLLCEVSDENLDLALSKAKALVAASNCLDSAIFPPGTQAAELWRIRADGAGLGGRTPLSNTKSEIELESEPVNDNKLSSDNKVHGNEQAWPGWEDAAVPPEFLGEYLTDFCELMEEHQVDGIIYGHFGDGCIHVRLDLPLHSQAGVKHAHTFIVACAKLLKKYHGSLSGEHGDGRARSELLPYMYSDRALSLFAGVKYLFDPNNLINPGVLTSPQPSFSTSFPSRTQTSRPVSSHPSAPHLFTESPLSSDSDFDSDPNSSPIASDTVLNPYSRESLPVAKPKPLVNTPQLTNQNSVLANVRGLTQDLRRPQAQAIPALDGFQFHEDHGDFTTAVHRCTGVSKCKANNSLAGGFMCPSYQATGQEVDSTRGRARILEEVANQSLISNWNDPAVVKALDLCLACKACSKDCPAGVDMAKYRSEALYRRYLGRGYARPLTHHILGKLPVLSRLATRVPGIAKLVNFSMRLDFIRKIGFWIVGIDPRRKMPPLKAELFSNWAKQYRIASGVCAPDKKYVLVWADSFSQTLEHTGAASMVQLLEKAGYTPLVADADVCCGLTWITTGQIPTARKKLTDIIDKLAPFAASGIPIVGVEPSCTAVLRDDILDLGITDPRAQIISNAVYTLAELLTAPAPLGPEHMNWLPDLSGIEIVAQPHCHHYSVMGWETDKSLLEQTGAKLNIMTGCCGLAGNFGMEKGHYDISVKIAEASLLPAIKRSPQAVYLADGFSCRTQAQQIVGRNGVHLSTLLLYGKNLSMEKNRK